MKIDKQHIVLPESITFSNAQEVYDYLLNALKEEDHQKTINLDFKQVNQLDSAGASAVNKYIRDAEQDEIIQSAVTFKKSYCRKNVFF